MFAMLAIGCVDDAALTVDTPAVIMTIAEGSDETFTFDIEPKHLELTSYDGNAGYASYAVDNQTDANLAVAAFVEESPGSDQTFFVGRPELFYSCEFNDTGEPQHFDACVNDVRANSIESGFVIFEPGWSDEAMAKPSHMGTLFLNLTKTDAIIWDDENGNGDDDTIDATLGMVGTIEHTGGTYTESSSWVY